LFKYCKDFVKSPVQKNVSLINKWMQNVSQIVN
jgi:hypothetical protein